MKEKESNSSDTGFREAYDFESFTNMSVGWVWPAKFFRMARGQAKSEINASYKAKFKKNLGVKVNDGAAEDKLLTRYVEVLHANAAWYWRAVARERRYRNWFVVASIALLGGLPFFLLSVPSIWEFMFSKPTQPEQLASQTVAALTGFVAVHRSINAWLGQRRVIGHFWRARSDLVDVIYSLETDRGGLVGAGGVPSDALIMRFQEDIKKGRTIVREETAKFFDEYSTPNIDLGATILDAQKVASDIYSKFKSPGVQAIEKAQLAEKEKLRAVREAEASLAVQEAQVSILRRRLKQTDSQLDQFALTENPNDAERRQLMQLKALHERLSNALIDAEMKLVDKQSAFTNVIV